MTIAMSAQMDSRLDRPARPVALQRLGDRAGRYKSAMGVKVSDTQCLHGPTNAPIEPLADAYVRGDNDMGGEIANVVDMAAELTGTPAAADKTMVVGRLLRHLRARWLQRSQSEAMPAQLHPPPCGGVLNFLLDPQQMHACAHLGEPPKALAQADEARLEHVCNKLQLQRGQLLLEIGAGGGNLLLWAAENHGVHAMGTTRSREQHAHVNDQITSRGLQGRVAMRLLDYRDLPLTARFDRIVSLGMFEQVGSSQLPDYFKRLHCMLKPGGLLIQQRLTASRIDDHQPGDGMGDCFDPDMVFDGELLHVSRVARSLSASGLALQGAEDLGLPYAQTLRAWSTHLEERPDRTRALTIETTARALRLYLAACAFVFEQGFLSIHQLLASHPPRRASDVPLRRAQQAQFSGHRHNCPSGATGVHDPI